MSEKKFVFAQPEVKYVGYIVNGEGTKADPDKVRAISAFPQPTNPTELRSFRGLINQLGGYSKEMLDTALPLRPLLK